MLSRVAPPLALILTVLIFAYGAEAEAEAENLLRGAGWQESPPTGGDARIAVDGGSLFVERSEPTAAGIAGWSQSVPAPAAPSRLRLTVRLRCRDLAPQSYAGVLIMFYEEAEIGWRQIGVTEAALLTSNSDWKAMVSVVRVPDHCRHVVVLAHLAGRGRAWFDDVTLVETDEEVTPEPTRFPGSSSRAQSAEEEERYRDLARGSCDSIPWVFDLAAARSIAREEAKPILAYVRSTGYFDEGLPSARSSLVADAIPHYDDGFGKDVLFRVGPLSDPTVSALIRRRFVPLLLTYHFPSQLGATPGSWWRHYFGGPPSPDATFRQDTSLRVQKVDTSKRRDGWLRTLELPDPPPTELRLKVSVRAEWLGSESLANISVLALSEEGTVLATAEADGLREPSDGSDLEARLELPPGCTKVRVLAWLQGDGQVWFDDLSAVPDGEIDPGIGFRGRDLVTPALVALKPSGEVLCRVHRVGVLSSDHVDAWLRGALRQGGFRLEVEQPEDLFLGGELEQVVAWSERGESARHRVLRARSLTRLGFPARALHAIEGLTTPDARLARGVVEMRRGRWAEALAALEPLTEPDEVVFRRAWCLHRLGQRDEAVALFRELASDSVYGRKAAACLLPSATKLWLAASERTWPRPVESARGTEAGSVEGFSAEQSLRALMELQHPNGSFGAHSSFERGSVTAGPWIAAFTALGAEALWRWREHIPEELRPSVDDAHRRAVRFLVGWVEGQVGGEPSVVGPFNYPYVLGHLARVGEKAAARGVVDLVVQSQNEDGTWSVYGPARPTSFNTALCLLALAIAKERGYEVPETVLATGATALQAMRRSGSLYPYAPLEDHEWMTTDHGSIARDPLCEHALLATGGGSPERLSMALQRFLRYAPRLRAPTKQYASAFNPLGHGGYFFFFAHRNALAASAYADDDTRARVVALVRDEVLRSREGDGTFMDHYMYGRAYGTAAALCLVAP